MASFMQWLADVAIILFNTLSSSPIGQDHDMLMHSYKFALCACLMLLACCLWLVPLLFKAVISIFRRI